MSYSEDAQPNEVRHARKGNARVPAIRTSRLTAGPQQHRGYTPQQGHPFYRGRGRGFVNTGSGQVASGSNRAPGSFMDGPANRSINRGSHPSLSWRGSTPDMGRSRTHQPNQSRRRHGLNNANATYGTAQTVVSKAENLDPLPVPAQLEPMRVESGSEVPMIVDSTSMDYDIPPEATPPNIRRAASSLEDANRLASDSRPSWPFDPKQPSLSISLTRVFPGYVPPHVTSPGSSSYMESSAARYPMRASPPSREYIDDDEAQSVSATEPTVLSMSATLSTASPLASPTLTNRSIATELQDVGMSGPEITPSATPQAPMGGQNGAALRVAGWGCWSALRSPPKFRSGTLVLGHISERLPDRVDNSEQLHLDSPAPSHSPSSPPPMTRVDVTPAYRSSPGPACENLDGNVPERLPEHGPRTSSTTQYGIEVQLRRDPQDKPRRLFILPTGDVLSITMRGCFDLVKHDHPQLSVPLRGHVGLDTTRQLVDDVCLLPGGNGVTCALGLVRSDQQLSLVRVKQQRVTEIGSFDRPVQSDKNGGISAICATMQSGLFATGGYDHLVHLWSYSGDRPTASPVPLPIRHTAAVQSLLAIRDTSHKLVTAGADCTVNVFDLSSERVVNTLKLSNSVYHVHPAISEFCSLFEIGHREQQFEVRDHRLVPTVSVVRFGYPSARVHGRFVRGAIQGTTFASGGSEKDGCVRLWDLRKPTEILRTVPCLPGRKVTQLAFGDELLVASSEDHYLAFINPIGDPADSR